MKPAVGERIKVRNTFLGFARAVSGTDETALIEAEKFTGKGERWFGWISFSELEAAPLPEVKDADG